MKKIMLALLALLVIILLVAGAYVAYLFIDYKRLDDHIDLEAVQRSDQPLRAGEELSILSWNLGFGAYNDDFSFFMDGGKQSRAHSREICEENIRTAIDFIDAQDADLILLQEVDVNGTRSHHVDQVSMIVDAFENHSAVFAQNYDSSYLFYPFHQPIGAAVSGIITMSDAPVESALRRSLPIEGGLRKFLDLDRCYSVSRIPLEDGRNLMLFNLHLSAYTADGTIATEQLEMLLGDMQAEYAAGNYVIAGGDFNKDLWGDSSAYTGISGEEYTWAQSFPVQLLPEGFSLVDSCNPENPVLSCRDTGDVYKPGETYEVTLDGFIVSDNVHILHCEVLDAGFRVSDHNPVKMRFILN